MKDEEIEMLDSILKSAIHYVEFGSGGSTVLASSRVAGSITSVDSSQQWLDKVSSTCMKKSLTTLSINIGPLKEWGWPSDESRREYWPLYHSDVWEKHPSTAYADTFLVDGRFRVACFVQILLNSRGNPLILIHDYNRTNYHVVESYAQKIAVVQNLALFRRSTIFDETRARACLQQHENNPA